MLVLGVGKLLYGLTSVSVNMRLSANHVVALNVMSTTNYEYTVCNKLCLFLHGMLLECSSSGYILNTSHLASGIVLKFIVNGHPFIFAFIVHASKVCFSIECFSLFPFLSSGRFFLFGCKCGKSLFGYRH